MFGIGANELILILLFGFLIFGPDKLPAMAKTVGQVIAKFRSAQDEMNRVIKEEVFDPTAEDPLKKPLEAVEKLQRDATKEDQGESFTARKARYDRQRAERKAAQMRKAEQERASQEEAAAGTAEAASATGASVAAAAASAPADDAAKKAALADELYGINRAAKIPKAADAAAAPAPAQADKPKTPARPTPEAVKRAIAAKKAAQAKAAAAAVGEGE